MCTLSKHMYTIMCIEDLHGDLDHVWTSWSEVKGSSSIVDLPWNMNHERVENDTLHLAT